MAAMTAMLATSNRRSRTQTPKMSATGCLARLANSNGRMGSPARPSRNTAEKPASVAG